MTASELGLLPDPGPRKAELLHAELESGALETEAIGGIALARDLPGELEARRGEGGGQGGDQLANRPVLAAAPAVVAARQQEGTGSPR